MQTYNHLIGYDSLLPYAMKKENIHDRNWQECKWLASIEINCLCVHVICKIYNV